jgi:hypothetical protein
MMIAILETINSYNAIAILKIITAFKTITIPKNDRHFTK